VYPVIATPDVAEIVEVDNVNAGADKAGFTVIAKFCDTEFAALIAVIV